VRISISVGWRGGAATLSCAAIIAGATACGTTIATSSGTSGASSPSASSRPSADPLAGLTAAQIARKATADLKAASSVHIAGAIKDSGQIDTLNLTLSTKACTGTFGIKGKGSVRLVKVGNALWIKPDNRFWRSAAGSGLTSAVLQILSGQYIKASAKDPDLARLDVFCNPRQLAGAFKTPGDLVKGGTTTVSGQPVLALKNTSGPDTAYVTISAHPEFVRLDGGGNGNGRLDFSRYNVPVSVAPPSADQIIDGARYGF
jgi:hypothetical protein